MSVQTYHDSAANFTELASRLGLRTRLAMLLILEGKEKQKYIRRSLKKAIKLQKGVEKKKKKL